MPGVVTRVLGLSKNVSVAGMVAFGRLGHMGLCEFQAIQDYKEGPFLFVVVVVSRQDFSM